jgi:hypothetical protein
VGSRPTDPAPLPIPLAAISGVVRGHFTVLDDPQPSDHEVEVPTDVT